ncbi:Sec-independent protein translocase protein TatB [Roseiterribacter gracilis]|uniref:Sec-independent protein translocase protein TatB n=1 Tax=Roseiterribacter gracilis TaxID=2812848 RepID=A0A8S8X625_9PROT|nr:Sec-independent protein translocase protein TatB [Rhodospirillales bacterium TMPK1]
MFDLDSGKLVIIAIVALIFIGPKDLPRAIRTVTTWIRAAQRMAREFQSNVDDFVRESELHEMREQARKMAMSVQEEVEKHVDPDGELKKTFNSDPLTPMSDTPTPEADPLQTQPVTTAEIEHSTTTPQPEIVPAPEEPYAFEKFDDAPATKPEPQQKPNS